jgi:hypothetical protein
MCVKTSKIQKICVGICLLGLIIFVVGTVFAEDKYPIAQDKALGTLSDCFYKITDKQGKEIGYIHYTIKETMWQDVPCYEVTKEDECSGGWLFVKSRMEGKEKACVGKERGILYFERIETHNVFSPFKAKMKINYTGVRDGNKIIMTEKSGEIIVEDKGKEHKKEVEAKETKKEIDLSKIDCLSYEIDLPVMSQIINLSVGEKKGLRVFDPEFSVIREGEIEVKEKVKIRLSEKEYMAYHLRGKFDKEKIDIWVTEDGKLMLKKKDSDGEMILSTYSSQNYKGK